VIGCAVGRRLPWPLLRVCLRPGRRRAEAFAAVAEVVVILSLCWKHVVCSRFSLS